MLTIHFGDLDNVIYNTSVYFNNVMSPEWLNDELAQRMIKSIDRATVVGPNAVDSKILGVIPVEKLSSGVKTLLLLRFMPDKVYNATNCGDNCAYWILKIAKMQDITINLYHMMDFGNRRFTARIFPALITLSVHSSAFFPPAASSSFTLQSHEESSFSANSMEESLTLNDARQLPGCGARQGPHRRHDRQICDKPL